jgi:hypothetical protein
MAKVYRLHEGQDGTGWFVSLPITREQLRTIKTEGNDVATSIPSPFARIDLVKSAFRWVADNGIEGMTAQHKLVSEALDVAQLFFLYPKHKQVIRIVSWNPRERFSQMIQGDNDRHSMFSRTLEVFWNQDCSVYNFDRVNRLYFLLNSANVVIGGTSPATLFFAAPDVHIATEALEINCGNHRLFGEQYASLAQRDKSFIEYFYTLSRQNNFANLFPEVYSYLEGVKKHLSNAMTTKIANISRNDIVNFPRCPVLDNDNDPCEVLNIPLGIQEMDGNVIGQESDFAIRPELPLMGMRPLILPNERFSTPWTYTIQGIQWQTNSQVPYRNTQSQNESVLPVQGDRYFWLSAGNFFEDRIIELPYTIDSTKFMTCGSRKHLLPLTPTFFQYFRAENVSTYLKLDTLSSGGIEARLEIPVRNGKISFKKLYHKEDIVKMEIHLAILPFLCTSSIDLDYTLALQDKRFDRSQELFIESYAQGSKLNINAEVVRKKGEQNTIRSVYYKTKAFEYIRVGNNSNSGFIVPRMKVSDANQSVSFAVDFGTTNTHIEYKFGVNTEKAIDVTPDIPMWQSLIDRKEGEPKEVADDNNFERELFPFQFNNATNYKFPFRTALTYNQNLNFNEPVEVFTHTNNFFLFEKVFYSTYLHLHTKLKWSNYTKPQDKILVENYIECLLYMVLYKTLLLNGDPQHTRITWFYPVSMDSFEQGIFFEVWQKAYRKIFKTDSTDNINAIPESIAPYLHYRNIYPGLSLSVDIGGGSSDIAVFKNASSLPEFISSVKFAGNAIFGDGFPYGAFSNTTDNNGFVRLYRAPVEDAIGNNPNKREILSDIVEKRKDSADFSSFLFSLENEKDLKFNYSDLLRQDRSMKLPILVFYGAIVYYSANLLKKQGIAESPKNILLSGTASKTIKILDSGKEFPNISNFFRYILKQITGTEPGQLKIALSDSPKEITCKGVLKAGINADITNCPMVFWIGGNDTSVWSKSLNMKTDIPDTPFYKDLDTAANKELIEASIIHFFDLIDRYVNHINLEGDFGIDNSAYMKFKAMRSLNIKDYLEQGLNAFYKSPEKHIEETLFFYPLIGILNRLAFELANSVNQ